MSEQTVQLVATAFPNVFDHVCRTKADFEKAARDAKAIGWRIVNGHIIAPKGQRYDDFGRPIYA